VGGDVVVKVWEVCHPVPAFAHSAMKLEVAECESSVKYPHEDHTSSDLEMEVPFQE